MISDKIEKISDNFILIFSNFKDPYWKSIKMGSTEDF